MPQKPPAKKVGKTVYFDPEDLEYLEECSLVTGHKLSQEVAKMIKIVRALRAKNNEEAIRLVTECNQPRG